MQKPCNLSFSITADKALQRCLDAEVKRTGLSRSAVVRTALRTAFGLIRPAKNGVSHATR